MLQPISTRNTQKKHNKLNTIYTLFKANSSTWHEKAEQLYYEPSMPKIHYLQ